MTFVAGETKSAIIVTDTSVLINFLRIDRTDLIACHSHDFLCTDHVAVEISDRYPDQQQRFAEALDAGFISVTSSGTSFSSSEPYSRPDAWGRANVPPSPSPFTVATSLR